MKKTIAAAALTLATIATAQAAAEAYEGQVFETRGTPVIITDGMFTVTTENFPRPLAQYIKVSYSNAFSGLTPDRSSGWTRCRVPYAHKKTVVFECRAVN